MQLFIILVVVVSVFLLLIKLVGSLTGRISERMVTNYFRSAEALLERDRLPENWNQEVARMARRGSARHRIIYTIYICVHRCRFLSYTVSVHPRASVPF